VATIGSPSGIAATARASPMESQWRRSCPRARPIATGTTAIATVRAMSLRASASRRTSSGVTSSSASSTRRAILPSSVRIPVAMTRAIPAPRVAAVPLKRRERRSVSAASGGTGRGSFPTGADSPVSADSFAWRRDEAMMRRSAAIRSPASRITMSPGTRLAAGTTDTASPRRTRARVSTRRRSASTDRTARSSTTNARMAFTAMTTAIAEPSSHSPNPNATAAAAARIAITGDRNCRRRIASGRSAATSRSRFGP